jgi:hypothetical protein
MNICWVKVAFPSTSIGAYISQWKEKRMENHDDVHCMQNFRNISSYIGFDIHLLKIQNTLLSKHLNAQRPSSGVYSYSAD